MTCANNPVSHGVMVVYGYLHCTLPHYHHNADLSESIKQLRCLSDIFSSMCLRLGQFSQLSFMQYVGLCGFSSPIVLMMIVRIPFLDLIIIIKSEVWPVCHCLGLSHETMVLVCSVCISIFLSSVSFLVRYTKNYVLFDYVVVVLSSQGSCNQNSRFCRVVLLVCRPSHERYLNRI